MGRFSGNCKALCGLRGFLGEDISVPNLDRFTRKSDATFDVVRFCVFDELENDHLPTLGFSERVSEFANKNSITGEGAVIRDIGLVEFIDRSAQWADCFGDHRSVWNTGDVVEFGAGTALVAETTFGALQIFMRTHEGRRH